jgi:hypothetical protein
MGHQGCAWIRFLLPIITLRRRDFNLLLLNSPIDEDIPTTQPSPPTVDDPIVADQDKSNDEIRIGPITRARAKLLQQQVNSLLAESDIYCNENFILPKFLLICMIRFIGEEGVRGSEEMQHMEHDVVIKQESAREEREAGATSMENITT